MWIVDPIGCIYYILYTAIYALNVRTKDGKVELCARMADYVKKRGKVIVINPEKDKTMVQVCCCLPTYHPHRVDRILPQICTVSA